MSIKVEYANGDKQIAWIGANSHVHMSSADVEAHNLFRQGFASRVVILRAAASGGDQVLYTLTKETHRVDEHGQVRPIMPEGATGAGKRQVGTIDLTPSWKAVLPMLVLALTDGTDDARKIATDELQRMAEAADRWVNSNR